MLDTNIEISKKRITDDIAEISQRIDFLYEKILHHEEISERWMLDKIISEEKMKWKHTLEFFSIISYLIAYRTSLKNYLHRNKFIE